MRLAAIKTDRGVVYVNPFRVTVWGNGRLELADGDSMVNRVHTLSDTVTNTLEEIVAAMNWTPPKLPLTTEGWVKPPAQMAKVPDPAERCGTCIDDGQPEDQGKCATCLKLWMVGTNNWRAKPEEDKCATCELKNLRMCATCADNIKDMHLEPCRSCVGKLELPNWRAK